MSTRESVSRVLERARALEKNLHLMTLPLFCTYGSTSTYETVKSWSAHRELHWVAGVLQLSVPQEPSPLVPAATLRLTRAVVVRGVAGRSARAACAMGCVLRARAD